MFDIKSRIIAAIHQTAPTRIEGLGERLIVTDSPLQGARVLVIDALSGQGRMVCTILRDMGIENIVVADSGSEALDILRERHFDLILGHMEKPGFDAEDFARTLRGGEAAPNRETPLLLVTDEPVKSKLLAALQAGVTSFIAGAFTAERLRRQIMSVLQSR